MNAHNKHAMPKTIQTMAGSAIGKSIKHQLPMLQFSIGCAPGAKALIAINAIDSTMPVHDMQPIVIFVDFLTSSFM